MTSCLCSVAVAAALAYAQIPQIWKMDFELAAVASSAVPAALPEQLLPTAKHSGLQTGVTWQTVHHTTTLTHQMKPPKETEREDYD